MVESELGLPAYLLLNSSDTTIRKKVLFYLTGSKFLHMQIERIEANFTILVALSVSVNGCWGSTIFKRNCLL